MESAWVESTTVRCSLGLTVHNSAAPLYGLQVGLMWFIPGMSIADYLRNAISTG